MSVEVAEVPTLTTTTPEPQTTPAPAPESASLSDHEAQFGKHGTGPVDPNDDTPLTEEELEDELDSRGRKVGARRGKGKMVKEIIAQRKQLRELREQLEKAATPAPVQPAPAQPKPVYQVPKVPTGEFTDEQPKLEQFADSEDPYGDWILARSEWSARKREHEAVRQHQQAYIDGLSRQEQQYWQGVEQAHNTKLQAHIASNPALFQAMANAGRLVQYGSLLDRAIVTLDNRSVDVAVYLATHPDELDEFVLFSEGKPVNQQTVGILQRTLLKKVSTAATGAVAPSVTINHPPTPLTPVRTGAIRTAETPPGDDSMSLAAHERHYGKRTKR